MGVGGTENPKLSFILTLARNSRSGIEAESGEFLKSEAE
jgi:hypothetical protein